MNTTKTLSQSPAAVAARARRAAKFNADAAQRELDQRNAQGEDVSAVKPDASDEPTTDLPEGNPGVFSAMASTLSVEQAEAAEAEAIAALSTAKASAKKAAPSAKPASTERYALGAYKGRAGAMFAFMQRCGTLGEGFTREDAVTSMTAKAPHAAVSTRAQVLDYFAWAVRHGLLVVHVGEVVAPVAAKPAKAPKKSRKGAKAAA